jgi:hypothetical protein
MVLTSVLGWLIIRSVLMKTIFLSFQTILFYSLHKLDH